MTTDYAGKFPTVKLHLSPEDYSAPSSWWAQAKKVADGFDMSPTRRSRLLRKRYDQCAERKFANSFRYHLKTNLGIIEKGFFCAQSDAGMSILKELDSQQIVWKLVDYCTQKYEKVKLEKRLFQYDNSMS